jgi:hypothetical protein
VKIFDDLKAPSRSSLFTRTRRGGNRRGFSSGLGASPRIPLVWYSIGLATLRFGFCNAADEQTPLQFELLYLEIHRTSKHWRDLYVRRDEGSSTFVTVLMKFVTEHKVRYNSAVVGITQPFPNVRHSVSHSLLESVRV